MLVVRDQKMSYYPEYAIIKSAIETLWVGKVLAREEMNDSVEIYELAARIYGQMYHTDNILSCKADDVKEEYGALVDLLKELKKYHSSTEELQVCITSLENCLKNIPVITGTQFLTDTENYNPLNDSKAQDTFSLIVAECSFKMLYEVFDDLLGDSLAQG